MKYYSMTHDFSGRKIKKSKPTGETFKKLKLREGLVSIPSYTYRGMDTKPPSQNLVDYGVASKAESKKYTGTLVKGISTLHKSNAVPILSQEEAVEHASMRR